MKKKYAALLVAAAIMAVPGTLAMAAGSPNTNATVSHGGGHSSSASSKSAGLNVNAGTITNKTTTGIKNNGQNGSNGITMQLDLHPISRSKTATAGQLLRKYLRSMQVSHCIV
mgnify:CR=1 FL=1